MINLLKMKKGFTKYWIEIIGGIIIVVVILLIFIYFGSSISTAVEDANNKQAFNDLKALMAKAMTQGEETLTPFKLRTDVDQRAYAAVIIPRETADYLYSGSYDGKQLKDIGNDGKFAIKKCTTPNIGNLQDACLCLLRIDYSSSFFADCVPYNNLITVNAGSTWEEEFQKITTWANNKLLNAFDKEGNDYAVERIKVMDCARIIEDIGCTYRAPDGTMYPCTLRYFGKPLVWLAGLKGDSFQKRPIKFEIFILEKQDYGWFLNMKIEGGSTVYNANDKIPCDTWCGKC